MVLKFFNTLTRSVEELNPVHKNEVRMYHCGPTVYDFAHIGNHRTFILNDILRRTVEYSGYKVKQVMNITDIDDKMIARAAEKQVSLQALAHQYTNFLLADFEGLNILTPEVMPCATAHIGGMIAMIEKLLRDEYAYIASDGVYFEVSKSKDYGALAHLDLDADTESRIENASDKKSPRDFALWKFEDADDHGTAYDASFGRGRPGWHIECSEMSRVTLGETLDIHTGGVDLIFPHHTNEIAQSEAVSGKQFVKTWLHTEFIMIDGQKMSKSLGNIITLKTIVERGTPALAYRYFILGTHYRSKANFTWDGLQGSHNALKRLAEHFIALSSESGGVISSEYKQKFSELMYDDLDTPRALALMWSLLKDTAVSNADKKETLLDFDKVLGFDIVRLANIIYQPVPDYILKLSDSREEARRNKDWEKSDQMRDEINALGWEILDSEKGPTVRKK